MSATDKLKQLAAGCKCGVYVTINQHRDVYETAHLKIIELESTGDCLDNLDPQVRATMIDTDSIVEVQFYPKTPVSFGVVYHHDIDAALDEALAALDNW